LLLTTYSSAEAEEVMQADRTTDTEKRLVQVDKLLQRRTRLHA